MPRVQPRWPPLALAALFGLSGGLHLLRPGIFRPLVPRALPARDAIVALSGLAELVCAVGLASGQRWAAPASVALLVAVYPGNIQFALDRAGDPTADRRVVALAWLRLPLQWPLIQAARIAGRSR